MKIATLTILVLTALAAGCSTAVAGPADKGLTVAGKTLTLQGPPACAQAPRPRRELAAYLSQYDASGDPKENIDDETPRTPQEIRAIKKSLVEQGFHYPTGKDSVITWMDFDGDGVCDFTASAGIGGMRAVDRMFLFRGLPNKAFRLVDAHYTYMEGATIPVPYIPITVPGEKLPILAKKDTLMQWQAERAQFATCESIAHSPAGQRPSAPALVALCPHAQRIYTWASDQLPNKNEIAY